MDENLKKEDFTADDLLQHLRNKQVFNATEVEFSVLEPSGTVSKFSLKPKLIGNRTR